MKSLYDVSDLIQDNTGVGEMVRDIYETKATKC